LYIVCKLGCQNTFLVTFHQCYLKRAIKCVVVIHACFLCLNIPDSCPCLVALYQKTITIEPDSFFYSNIQLDSWLVLKYHSGIFQAIPLWVGAVSTDDGFGHCWGRNGEFCVVVCIATRISGILAESVKGTIAVTGNLCGLSGRHWLYASLIGSKLRQLRGYELPCSGLYCLCRIFFL